MSRTHAIGLAPVSEEHPRTGGRAVLARWIAFNVVGLAGIVVQLGVLAVLVHLCGWTDLIATAIAVECAILHNFVWHQRWTWHDRPSTGRDTWRRLGRFHVLNGSIALAGNVAVTAFCTTVLRLDVIVANMIAIVLCSMANFAAGERLVFAVAHSGTPRPRAFRKNVVAPLASILMLSLAARPSAAGPGSPTMAAWNAYERALDAAYAQAAAAPANAFFALDRNGLSPGWRTAVLRGGHAAVKLDAAPVPDGKIHHWVGAIFVPNITIDALINRLERLAGHESENYEDVLTSRLLDRNGDHLRVFMKLRRTNLITVTYNTEHTVEYRRLTPTRGAARSVATKIAELADADTPREREKSSADDNGFLWRLNAYWRYEAAQGGVIVECESVSLSRAVPFLVRPVANPMVDRIARESLERTLVSLRTTLTTDGARERSTTSGR